MTVGSSEIFLTILNGIIEEAVKPETNITINSLDQKLAEEGIDSLDTALIYVHLTEMYGVTEEVTEKKWSTSPLLDLYNFITKYKTRDFSSAEEALSYIK